MARLPQPGSDQGTWGDILNDYLAQSLNSDGTLKDNVISEAKLDSAVQTKLNATSTSTPTDSSVTPTKLDVPLAPSDGDVLSYNSGDFEWVPAPTGGSGEVNTASNVGSTGVGVYKQKTGANLELKNIAAASNRVSVTNNVGNDTVDVDVVTANLGLTQSDVGLGNVDNTSDADKPVSTAVTTALSSKADTSTTITGATSLSGGGSLAANRTISLLNDAASPGNSRYYGTDGTGTKGFHTIPTQDPTMGGDLSGTASNAQIASGVVGPTELADSAVTEPKLSVSNSPSTNEVLSWNGSALAWASPNVGAGNGPNGAITVASSDAPQAIKDACEYVCTGTNDQTIINQALQEASRPNDGFGGTGRIGVCLVGHNFYVGNNNSTSITMYPSTHLFGLGPGTLIQPQFTTTDIDRGVIELLNSNTAHVLVSNLTIARANAVSWEGHGIKFTGVGNGDTYEIKSGNDPYNRLENVWIGNARGKGAWLTGTSGGSRESQVLHCTFWNCDQQGLLIDGSSDSQVSDCRANGGDGYPRFEIAGGNTKIANCKAYYSGNGTTNGDGYLISSSRCEIANCAAQDNGRWGFRFTGGDVTASGLAADSNSRTQVDGGGFAIEANGVFEGLHAFDRNQTPASRQLRGVVFSGTPDVYLSGRMDVPSGTAEIVNAPSADSFARVVRSSGGVYTVG